MARDPLSWSTEDERRRRATGMASMLDATLPPERQTRPNTTREDRMPGAPARSLVRDIRRGAEYDGLGGAIVAATGADIPRRPRSRPTAPARENPFANVESRALAPRRPLDRSNGLTRIVQTAPGVFTDNPNAQGEVRYYNDMGFRADTSFGGGKRDGAGMSGPAEWARAEQAAALDPMTDAGHAAILESGLNSQRILRDRQADAQRRFDLAAQYQRSPEEQAAFEQAQLGAATELASAEIEAGGRLAAAQTTAAGQRTAAQQRAAEAALAAQTYAAERASDPETAARFLQEYLGDMENLSPEDITTLTVDPTNTRGGQARAAVRGGLARALGDPNITPLQTQRAGPMQRYFDNPFRPWQWFNNDLYATDSDWFTDTFNPTEVTGLTAEQYELFRQMEAEAARRGR